MSIAQRIHSIQEKISEVATECRRLPEEITLMAVSKNQSIEGISQAIKAGILNFGESYWQEADAKINHFKETPLIWHFIGPIQSNKASAIAKKVSWATVDRVDIASLLSRHRPDDLPPLNLCIQINIDNEPAKSGIPLDELPDFVHQICYLPRLHLRGLMIIPKPQQDEACQYRTFLRLKQALDTLNMTLAKPLDTLSMGMSDDITPAIKAGSTLLRIGRSIFKED